MAEELLGGIELGKLLDVGAGTADISLEAMRLRPDVHVVATDFTHEMMRIGQVKDQGGRLPFVEADALHLPFATGAIDTANASSSAKPARSMAGPMSVP